MSHRTVQSSVFPTVVTRVTRPARQRMVQDYTAINVDDPHSEEKPGTPEEHIQQREVRIVRQDDRSNPRLDNLVSRQEQLLNHQIQVSNRQDELAANMANQNHALNQSLLKQVLSNKDSMINNLAYQQQSEWDDHTKDLLTQHIRYIVAFVQRQNHDIEALEAEIRGRDIATVGTNKAVNKIEVHQVTMLQDLRSRIVRSEAAISKHSKDILMLMDEIRRLEAQQQQTRERMMNDVHRLEAEVMSMTGELERQAGEQRADLSHLRSDSLHRLSMLEDKQKAFMIEFRDSLDGNKSNVDHHLDRMEAKFQAMINKATSGWGDLMGQVDKHIAQSLMSILSRLGNLEDHMSRDRQQMKSLQHNVETQVIATLRESLAYNDAELAQAKLEFRKGFTELQESLANMKGVVEGRRKILANQMQKEIGQVKKAMYLELPNLQPASNTITFRNVDKSNEW